MLTEIFQKLREAATATDEAKQNWLSLQREGDVSQHAARNVFHARDDEFSAAGEELRKYLQALRERFRLNALLRGLERDQRQELTRFAVMLQLDHLLIEQSEKDGLPSRHGMSFVELVGAARDSALLLDAARKLNDLRMACEGVDQFDEAIFAFEYPGDESIWQNAVENYRAALDGFEQGSDDERMSEATHECMNNARKLHDHLIAELSDEVRERCAYGGLHSEMKELEFDLLRYLRAMIDSGALGPVETGTETQPQAQPATSVSVETLEETETRMPETDEEIRAAVDEFLKGLNLN